MQKITNYMKMLGVAVLLMAGIKTNAQSTCTANFIYTTGPGGVVTFTSTSVGTNSTTMYYWSFGNSTTYTNGGVMGMNATTTYSANGNYVVTLFINTIPTCSTAIQYTINITTATGCGLTANFNQTAGSGGTMNFNNTSTNASGASYKWFFGDGSPMNTSTSPSHVYATNGTYSVKMIATISPSCIDSTTHTVVVNNICNLNASFTYSQTPTNGWVQFTSTSTGTNGGTTYLWSFGDASAPSGSSQTWHNYATGTYTVMMIATNPSTVTPLCKDTAYQVISVTNTCNASAGFSLVPTSTTQYWNAYPTVTGSVSAVVWSWGDGSYSTTLYTSHQYSAAGTYSICLSVTIACGSTASYCGAYNIYKGENNNAMVFVNVVDPSTIGVGLTDVSSDAHYNMFPNPNNGAFNINMTDLKGDRATITVYNLLGDAVYTHQRDITNGSVNENVNLGTVANGVYFVQVNANNKTYTQKIVISK